MSQVAKEIKKADQFSHIAGRQPAVQRSGSVALLQDNRPEAILQRKLRSMMDRATEKHPSHGLQVLAQRYAVGGLEKDKQSIFPDMLKPDFSSMGHDVNPMLFNNSNNKAQLKPDISARTSDILLGAGQGPNFAPNALHVTQQKQRLAPHSSAYQSPVSSIVNSFDDSVTTSVMSNDKYADWQQTAQGKFSMHGTCTLGDQTYVSQLKNSAEIIQGWDWSPKKISAGLVIFEGLLTAAAGVTAAVATGGIAALPGIITGAIGMAKIGRGILMLDEKPGKKTKVVIDCLRGLEAAASIVVGAIIGNPAFVVFAIAKAIRALLQAIIDWMGEETKHPKFKAFLKAMATTAHAVEVVALSIAGMAKIGSAEDGFDIAGGAVGLVIAGSKDFRTGMQAGDAEESHRKAYPQALVAPPNFPGPDMTHNQEVNPEAVGSTKSEELNIKNPTAIELTDKWSKE